MAGALAQRIANEVRLSGCVFDSCGLRVSGPLPPTDATLAFLRGEKIHLRQHRSKPLTPQLADTADLVFTMTRSQAKAAAALLGEPMAQKVVQLNEGLDLPTKKIDVDPLSAETTPEYRRIFAVLTAAAGRLVRTLDDPYVVPEYFNVKTVPRQFKRRRGKTAPAIDPSQRVFLANLVFTIVERSYEPATTSVIHEALAAQGQEIPHHAVEELLQQDLHRYVRLDRDGASHALADASKKRTEQARQRAQQERPHDHQRRSRARESAEKMTEKLARETLGITGEATLEDARKKYRTLVQRYHPDKFVDDPEFRAMAEEKARRINEAWELLEQSLAPNQS